MPKVAKTKQKSKGQATAQERDRIAIHAALKRASKREVDIHRLSKRLARQIETSDASRGDLLRTLADHLGYQVGDQTVTKANGA